MVIYGKNTVIEALNKRKDIKKIYVTENNLPLVNKNYHGKAMVIVKTLKEMDMLFKGNHQGIALEIDEYEYLSLEELLSKASKKEDFAVAILDGLDDPHNLGAIMRTADATGMDGLIIPKNRSVSLNETVAKVSTGAIEYVDAVQVTNLNQTIEKLKKNGFWIVGLDMDGEMSYTDYDFRGKVAVVVGNEGKGISRLVKENCDTIVSIPMVGHVNSLNASVSCSIIFYEILRKRG